MFHRLRDRDIQKFEDGWGDLQMRDDLPRIASYFNIRLDAEQWDISLLGSGPAVRAVLVDAVVACHQNGVTTFHPF